LAFPVVTGRRAGEGPKAFFWYDRRRMTRLRRATGKVMLGILKRHLKGNP
jgi:hypothetical protein